MPWLIHIYESQDKDFKLQLWMHSKSLWVNPLMKTIKSQIVEKVMKTSWDRKAEFQREMASLKKILMEINLKMKILECPRKTSEVSLINRLPDTEEKNHRWWIEDRINLYLTQKKMLNQNNLSTKYPGNVWHYEKTKSLKNWNRGRRKKVKGVEIWVNKAIEKGALCKEVYVQDQQRNYPWHIIIKTLSVQDEERILNYSFI